MDKDKREPWVLVIAILLPTIVTLAYFRLASSSAEVVQQGVYAVGKTIQFLLPVAWVWGVLRVRPRWSVGSRWSLCLGAVFGVAVMLATWYGYGALAGTDLMAQALTPIREKVMSLGLDSPWSFIAVGVFYAIVHSLLEEYYWRWFVYGRLRSWCSNGVAVAVSALGFMTHHVIVLATYFPHAPAAAISLSLCIAVGGAFWAWLYGRSGSLIGPWIGHLLVDAGIFAVGFRMAFSG